MVSIEEKIFSVVSVIFLSVVRSSTSQVMDDDGGGDDGNAPLAEDGGLNRHEELVIFSCVAVVFVMSITIVLFLWYVVDRTKERISQFERHLPAVVSKFRQEVAEEEENDHRRRIVLAGSLSANGEFEGVHPLQVNRGRVRLTSFTRKQDVGIGTDFPENRQGSSSSNDTDDDKNDESSRRPSTRTPGGAESQDFVFISGEYVPKEFLEKCPPPYAYDNPAYDNPYTENGDGVNELTRNKQIKGKRNIKRKGKDKSNVYESHV